MTLPGRDGFLPERARAWLAATAAIGLLVGCAGPRVIVQPDDRPGRPPAVFSPKPVLTQRGKASFYWEDSRTASGERFHPEALTAAHRKFPLQSWVRVTNERNHKSVIVRINDRGPYVGGRIIDLSRGAARQIDMVKSGVVPVRVELLKRIDVVGKPNLRVTARIRAKAISRLHGSLARSHAR
ncbi:MAG: septal ring lytic transglycosylase RlpA family protein [Terrimicrobiaceae bacterium]|nr:septal ring lytic transglycosylase RlpA family protein [Terrimicrobiaceae bacterium]